MTSRSIEDRLFDAADKGDATTLGTMLDEYPDMLYARSEPYEWTLLHAGARHLPVVELLLGRGLDPNTREKGDNTCAMHWAAAAGKLDVVQRLADAGGDVIGHGDDHELEVIGWTTCWEGCDDADHRAVARFLITRGARHHIFSAIAAGDADAVRTIVGASAGALSRRMSRNEDHQLPLHFAVGMNRPEMVSLLIDLGADPLGVDGSGYPAAVHAKSSSIDNKVMERIAAMTSAGMLSAARGTRTPRIPGIYIMAALALGDLEAAGRLWPDRPTGRDAAFLLDGLLHLMSKRGDLTAMTWLLDRSFDPNARWAHWDAEVTPLHLAILGGHDDAVRLLLERGADPAIRDSKHDGDATGWAEFFGRDEIIRLLATHISIRRESDPESGEEVRPV